MSDTCERYEFLAILGQGSIGQVWRVRHRDTGIEYALKRCLARDEASLAAFRQEIWGLSRLVHPHLVRHVEDFVLDGVPQLVMEIVDGVDLPAGQSEAGVRAWLPGVLSILDHLHHNGLVHGDLRPENLRLRADGHVILMDLGLLGPIGQVSSIRGTPAYMAPEIILGRPVDGRADLYALGCVLFQVFAGRPPFEGLDATSLVHRHVDELPPDLLTLVPELSPAMARVVHRLLAKEPSRRFNSGSEVLRALDLPAHALPPGVYLEPPLLGQDHVDAAIEGLFAATGPGTRHLVLQGGRSSGKSTWLRRVAAQARREGHATLMVEARGGSSAAYVDTVPLITFLLEEAPADVREATLPHVARLLPGRESLAAPWLDGPAEKARIFDAVTTLALASPRPRVLLIDEASRLDPDSRALLDHLAIRLAGTDGLWIEGRSEPMPPERSVLDRLTILHLQPLGEQDVRRVAEAVLGGGVLHDDVLARLFTLSKGNPGDLVTTVRHWSRTGAIRSVNGSWEAPLEELLIPRAHSAASLADLRATVEGDCWHLLEAIAVSGGKATMEELATLLDRPIEAIIDLLMRAQHTGTLRHRDGTWRLHDASLAAQFEAGSAPERRIQLHAKALEGLRSRLRDSGPKADVETRLRAARHAVHAGAFEEGWPWLRSAVEETFAAGGFREVLPVVEAWHDSQDPDRIRKALVQGFLASCARRLGRRDEAFDLLDDPRMAELAEAEPSVHADHVVTRGILLLTRGKYDEARATLESGAALASGSGLFASEVRARFYLGRCAYFTGQNEEAIRTLEGALSMAATHDLAMLRPSIMSLLAYLRTLTGPEGLARGTAELVESIALTRSVGNLYDAADALGNLGNAWMAAGRYGAAEGTFRDYLDLCERLADTQEAIFAQLNLATALYHLGNWPEARQRAERALAHAMEQRRPFPETYCLGLTGLLAMTGDEPATGLERLERARSRADEIGNHQLRLEVAAFRAEACRWLDDPAGAREALAAAGITASEAGGNRLAHGVLAWLEAAEDPARALDRDVEALHPGRPDLLAGACRARARAARSLGDIARARQESTRALALAVEAGLTVDALECRYDLHQELEAVAESADRVEHHLLDALARWRAGSLPGGDRLAGQEARRWLERWSAAWPSPLDRKAREFLDTQAIPGTPASGEAPLTTENLLVKLMSRAGSAPDFDSALQAGAAATGEWFDARDAYLFLVEDVEVRHQAGWQRPTRRPEPELVEAALNATWERSPLWSERPDGSGLGALPLVVGDTVTGAIVLDLAREARSVWPARSAAVKPLLELIGSTLRHARERALLQDRHRDAQAVSSVAEALLSSHDLESGWRVIAVTALAWTRAERILWLQQDMAGALICKRAWSTRGLEKIESQPFSQTLTAWALERIEPLFMLDAQDDDALRGQSSVLALGLRSVYVLPVSEHDTGKSLLYLDLQHVDPSGDEILPRLGGLARLWRLFLARHERT